MVLTTIVVAVALGIGAQVAAERLRLPAILPLLLLGMVFGPHGMGVFDPASLGAVLEVAIHLGVAIILFEGGLTLDPTHLARVGAPVRNLLTVGALVTGGVATVAAHELVGLSWDVAALFGAIMIVTGPTVIVPLLRHMIAPRRVKTILTSEGLIIDPIGAVLAYLVLQWILRLGIPWREMAAEVAILTVTGVVVGFAGGALSREVLRTRFVGGELRNLVVLAVLLVVYAVCEHQAPQSGILASVVMGFTLSAAELPDLVSLRAFKGQITALAISVLFILLAGELDVAGMLGLGSGAWLVMALLVFVGRPLSVMLSVWPSMLPPRERVVLAMIAPRGIVAAAVASLAARELALRGIAGAAELESLVYLAILVTGAWATAAAVVGPRALGFTSDPSRRRLVLVGENPLTEAIGRALARLEWTVVVVDSVAWRLERARAAGFGTVLGDARDAVTYEEAGVESDSLVVAGTTNDELNLLVAELVHHEFGVANPVVALHRPPEDLGRRSRAWVDLLGGKALDVPRWLRLLEGGHVRELDLEVNEETARVLRQAEREFPDDVLRLVAVENGKPRFDMRGDVREGWNRLVLLVAEGRALEMLTSLGEGPSSTPDSGSPSGEAGETADGEFPGDA